jgi:hypothetical protein
VKFAKERVVHLAESIVTGLHRSGYLELTGSEASLVEHLQRAILEELLVEERLNAEVRQLMKQYEAEIQRGGGDYQKMFQLIKSKLVKERKLIL